MILLHWHALTLYIVLFITCHDVSAAFASRARDIAIRHTKNIARDLRLAFGALVVSQQTQIVPQMRLTYCQIETSSSSDSQLRGGISNGSSNSSGTRTATSATTSATTFSSPYHLVESHNGTNFFSGWTFWTTSDPTNGSPRATVSGNRQSIRITTESTYNGVLVILDSVHMPTGCGTWPAWWSNGPNWPIGGEIDIVEGINDYTNNQATLHTDPGCSLPSVSADVLNITGAAVGGTNCAANETSNEGCGFRSASDVSFGAAFNDNGGGVYAMKWDDDGIRVYFWTQDTVPSDVNAGTPVPSRWGSPMANWPSSTCNSTKYFYNHSFIFDTTLCGDWAGTAWNSSGTPGQNQSCATRTGYSNCEDFVRASGASFDEAYWEIKSVKFYELS
ncbi:concanavalin A-like lectin/glucanase domain-containing protein [Desarmillaria tabescens]|uniref:Concanavalin A-like lectin/glucanase domain-containing protein n=1 Tax=Armillaria tabescens TaxID=1929756 RepID=A0AA39NDC6_ARMTA|nr:concanavalin A-like lectin/glucanase domain-containing protein [Desarmillaria tabescens]KAK0463535.1 concanavalin A-like lectin/glucanase domain-containing protein [Desarmillaria tabescens]